MSCNTVAFGGTGVEISTWEEGMKAFDSYLEAEERSLHTRQSYRADLRAFARWFHVTFQEAPQVGTLIESELREWKQAMIAKKHKPNSINRRLRCMKSFLRWANDEGIPVPQRMPKAEKQQELRPHWLTTKEEHRLMRTIEKAVRNKDRPLRDQVIVTVLLRTGIRVDELVNLLWSDVRISPRAGTFTIRRGKGAKRREVPVDIVCRELLMHFGYERHRDKDVPLFKGPQGKLTSRTIQRIAEGFRGLANLPELKCHTLRHTCLRRLIESGAKIQEAARIAGHTSIDTTNLYILPNEADLQAAVDRRAAAQYGESRED
jgi:integrase/recombinase XerC